MMQISTATSATPASCEKRHITGLRFIRDWLTQFKNVGAEGAEDEDEDGDDKVSQSVDPAKSPLIHDSFKQLIGSIFEAHMQVDSSSELICSLLEVLQTFSRESEWQSLFEQG